MTAEAGIQDDAARAGRAQQPRQQQCLHPEEDEAVLAAEAEVGANAKEKRTLSGAHKGAALQVAAAAEAQAAPVA